VAQRHAEFFEIGVDQITEKFRVDFAVAKDRLILAAEATEPIPKRPSVNPNKGRRRHPYARYPPF
jgi:hypothetical protein